jgi:hypothetical protein
MRAARISAGWPIAERGHDADRLSEALKASGYARRGWVWRPTFSIH